MTSFDDFIIDFFLFLFIFLAATTEIDSATSCVIKSANLLTLIKKTTDNNKNYTTKLVAENFNKDDLSPQEISGERVWKQAGFFGEIRTDYNMEKVNFPENSLIYTNQAYLTI